MNMVLVRVIVILSFGASILCGCATEKIQAARDRLASECSSGKISGEEYYRLLSEKERENIMRLHPPTQQAKSAKKQDLSKSGAVAGAAGVTFAEKR